MSSQRVPSNLQYYTLLSAYSRICTLLCKDDIFLLLIISTGHSHENLASVKQLFYDHPHHEFVVLGPDANKYALGLDSTLSNVLFFLT